MKSDTQLRFVFVVSRFLHWLQLMFAMRKEATLVILALAELPRATQLSLIQNIHLLGHLDAFVNSWL